MTQASMKAVLEQEEAKEVVKAYDGLQALLHEFMSEQHAKWVAAGDEVSQAKLKQPLLTRHGATQLLAVNFDPQLVKLLREVKYLLELGHEVPESALALNKLAEQFRVQRGSLQIICNKYNHIMQTMLDVEQPLLQQQLKAIDRALEKGQKHLTWKSHAINDFVRDTSTLVNDTYDTLHDLKTNMRGIQDVLNGWAANALIKRKPTATYSPEDFEEEHKQHLAARYADIGNEGKTIHKLLLESNKTLKVSKGPMMNAAAP
jgi:dynein heavy chain